METFTFKNYTYTVVDVGSKAEFDKIYHKLLEKANKGRSIVKELEKAYRVPGSQELFLIRYDEKRRALVPVRIARESVDGLLMRDRYDSKDKVVQSGIGQEMSHQSHDVYETVHKKHEMDERHKKEVEDKRTKILEELQVDGKNFQKRMEKHYQFLKELSELLERNDYQYRDDRDYKIRVDQSMEKIRRECDALFKRFEEIDRDESINQNKVQHLVPDDLKRSGEIPQGLYTMLEFYLFISVFNSNMEREWVTLRDYGLNFENLPLRGAELVDQVFALIHNTKTFVATMERILFPEKVGAQREEGVAYDVSLITEQVITILGGLAKNLPDTSDNADNADNAETEEG